MARNGIDLAQCVLRRDAIAAADNRINSSESGEAGILARIFRTHQGRFAFSQEPVTYLRYLDAPEAERRLPSISFEDRDALPGHLGGHFQMTNMDEPVLAHLIREFRPRGFLDLGCGLCGMVLAARNRGLEALGIDGDPSVAPDILHDFATCGVSSAILPPLPRPVLLWCVEFVEHVHERYLPHLLSVFERADVIFLTHAVPGQGGHHHVNERPAVYWVGVLAAIGFEIDEAASIACRRVAVNQYTRATGLVFVRQRGEAAAMP